MTDATYTCFPLFQRFQDAWKPFLPTIHSHRFDKHNYIINHGDPANHVWLIVTGWVSLLRHTPNGKQVTVGLCTNGDIFGKAALLTQASYPYTGEVLQNETEVIAIPAKTLRQLSQENAEFSNFLMETMNKRMDRVQLKLEQMSSLTAAQRLGCFLLQLCQQQGETSQVSMPIDKHVIASYLGMKPETLSRSFQQLKPLGIQVKQSTITVPDVGKLVEYVCGSCSESGLCDMESDAITAAKE